MFHKNVELLCNSIGEDFRALDIKEVSDDGTAFLNITSLCRLVPEFPYQTSIEFSLN